MWKFRTSIIFCFFYSSWRFWNNQTWKEWLERIPNIHRTFEALSNPCSVCFYVRYEETLFVQRVILLSMNSWLNVFCMFMEVDKFRNNSLNYVEQWIDAAAMMRYHSPLWLLLKINQTEFSISEQLGLCLDTVSCK